jgi:hypothetical protein
MALKQQGLENAIRMVRKIEKGEFVKRPVRKFATNVKAEVKIYAPHLDPSWHRSGRLKRKWYANVEENRIEFGNPAHSRGNYYAGWVQDKAKQVWWHARTGWSTIQDVAEKHLKVLRTDIIRELKK